MQAVQLEKLSAPLDSSYIEFAVSQCVDASRPQEACPRTDAFALMMQSSRLSNSLPRRWQTPNRKLELKNDLIEFLKRNKLGWTASYAQQCGELFVNTLADILWYIDGNHQTLADRGHEVCAQFAAFTNYNQPENRKKKKIDHTKLQAAELLAHSSALFCLAGNSYMKRHPWTAVREAVLHLADNLRKHAMYLHHQNEAVSANHAKRHCVRTDVDDFKVLSATTPINPTLSARYKSLHDALIHSHEYEPILLEDHSPADTRRRYDYNQGLIVPMKCVLYTYSGSKNHLHFVWKISCDQSETSLLQRNMTVQQELQKNLPRFHTRAMRREFIHSFGVATHAKPAFLREAYRRLTGDAILHPIQLRNEK